MRLDPRQTTDPNAVRAAIVLRTLKAMTAESGPPSLDAVVARLVGWRLADLTAALDVLAKRGVFQLDVPTSVYRHVRVVLAQDSER